MRTAPEFATIATFIQYLRDDERTTFSAQELQSLNFALQKPLDEIRAVLEEEGFSSIPQVTIKRVRGFTTSSNDRWFGPGSDPTHGGLGF